MKKRILFRVTNNLKRGGVQSRLCQVLPILSRDYGYEVHVVTYREPGSLVEGLAENGVIHHHLPMRSKWNPFAIARLTGLFRTWGADIVHGHSFGGTVAGILAGRLACVPVRVGQMHSRALHWYAKSPRGQKAQARREAWVHRHFGTHEFCVLEECRKRFLDDTALPGAYPSVLHNGIDERYFSSPDVWRARRQEGRGRLGLGEEKIVAGFLGRLTKGKGLPYLLERLRERPKAGSPFVFLIGGHGSEEMVAYCRRECASLRERGVDARFLGEIARPDTFYPILGCFLFPSEAGVEGFPGVCLEAAASGLPLLMRPTEIVGELLPYYPRIQVFEEGRNIYEALDRALALPAADGEGVRREFSAESMARRTHEAYSALLQHGKGMPAIKGRGRKTPPEDS